MNENKFSFITDEEDHIDYKDDYRYSSDILCGLYINNQSSLDAEEQIAVREYFLFHRSYVNSLVEIKKIKIIMKSYQEGSDKYLSFMSSLNLELTLC